jgi:hypothetical protein
MIVREGRARARRRAGHANVRRTFMKKLHLDADQLRVETFAPVEGPGGSAGTVEGFDLPETYSCNGTCIGPTECDSCYATCPESYFDCSCYCGGTRISRQQPDSCPCYPEPY